MERSESTTSINGVNGYKIFVANHQNQLESSGVPQHFWQTVYRKLSNMVSQKFICSLNQHSFARTKFYD